MTDGEEKRADDTEKFVENIFTRIKPRTLQLYLSVKFPETTREFNIILQNRNAVAEVESKENTANLLWRIMEVHGEIFVQNTINKHFPKMKKGNGEPFAAYEPDEISMIESSIECEKLDLANKLEEVTVKKVTDDDRIKLINEAILEISGLDIVKYADLQQYWIELKGKYGLIIANYETLYEKALHNEVVYKEEYRVEMMNLHEIWKHAYNNRIAEYKEKSKAKRMQFEEKIERENRVIQAERAEKSAKIKIQAEIIEKKNKALTKLHAENEKLTQTTEQNPTIDIENFISVVDYEELQEHLIQETKNSENYRQENINLKNKLKNKEEKIQKIETKKEKTIDRLKTTLENKLKNIKTPKTDKVNFENQLETPIANKKENIEDETQFNPKATSTIVSKRGPNNLFLTEFQSIGNASNYTENNVKLSKNTISKFNGEGPQGTAFDSWVKVFEKNAYYANWSEDRQIKEMGIYLEKTAANYYEQLTSGDRSSMEIIKKKFRERFDLIETPDICISRLMNARQKKDESARAWGQRIRTLYLKAYPPPKNPSKEEESTINQFTKNVLMQGFINGMNNEMVRYLKGRQIVDFNNAVDLASEREEVDRALQERSGNIAIVAEAPAIVKKAEINRQYKQPEGIALDTNRPANAQQNSIEKHCVKCNKDGHTDITCFFQRPCNMCKEMGHSNNRCPKRATLVCCKCGKTGHYGLECDTFSKKAEGQVKEICTNCGIFGHTTPTCRRGAARNIAGSSGAPNLSGGRACFTCNATDHFAAQCPRRVAPLSN